MQIVQIVSFNELAILRSIKAAVGSAAAARSRSNLTHGSSPYTSAGRLIKLSLEVLFNWCVLTEVGLRVDPSVFPRSGGPSRGSAHPVLVHCLTGSIWNSAGRHRSALILLAVKALRMNLQQRDDPHLAWAPVIQTLLAGLNRKALPVPPTTLSPRLINV